MPKKSPNFGQEFGQLFGQAFGQFRLAVTPCHSLTSDYPQGDSNEPRKTQEKMGFCGPGGTDSGTVTDSGTLDRLAAELMKLNAADRERLAALLVPGNKPEGRQDG
jgi:hypothetical protein